MNSSSESLLPRWENLVMRPAEVRDGRNLHRFVVTHGGLERNSAYAYLLMCERFGRSCLIAEAADQLAGFVLGIVSPERSDTLFVWQIGVAPRFRRRGVAATMLEALLARERPRYLEAHVTPNNQASEALFRSAARERSAPVTVSAGYLASWFPTAHAQERLFRLGPFAWTQERSA